VREEKGKSKPPHKRWGGTQRRKKKHMEAFKGENMRRQSSIGPRLWRKRRNQRKSEKKAHKRYHNKREENRIGEKNHGKKFKGGILKTSKGEGSG